MFCSSNIISYIKVKSQNYLPKKYLTSFLKVSILKKGNPKRQKESPFTESLFRVSAGPGRSEAAKPIPPCGPFLFKNLEIYIVK